MAGTVVAEQSWQNGISNLSNRAMGLEVIAGNNYSSQAKVYWHGFLPLWE